MPLKILTEDDYHGSAPGAVVTDGILAHTHIALLETVRDQAPVRCYVKMYPDMAGDREHRGIVNEMIGHILGSIFGVQVPKNAGLITLNAAQLTNRPSWSDEDSDLVGWWVQDAAAPSLKAHYSLEGVELTPRAIERLAQARAELAKSDQVNMIIAFDTIIANVDRNLGNLLRIKASKYLMIDHGLCLSSDDWLAEELDPEKNFVNKLHDFIGTDAMFLPFRHATISAHEKLAANIEPAIGALQEWLPYAIDHRDCAAVERFIRRRADTGTATKRMGLFI